MKTEIKQLIEQIKNGEVPQDYKKTKIGIVPNEWREISFDTIFKEFSVYTNDMGKYPLYSLTIENGIVEKTDRYERSHLVKKENSYKLLPIDYYAYNPMNIRFGAVARNKSNKDVMISGYYDIFTTKEKSDLKFMDSFLISNKMITYYNKVSTGSLLEKQRVHFSQFINFELPLPKQMDRKKIAEILSIQDKVIELKEKLIEEKKKQKKYLMQNLLTGKMRLKGFIGEWKRIELGEIFDYVQPTPYIVKTAIYDDNYKTPVLTAGKSFILGYTNENFGIYLDVPTVIFDDFTTSSQFVNFPFKVKSSAIKILKCKKNYDIVFCFAMLQSVRYVVGGHERHWISKFSNIVVKIPKIEEQKAIAKILSTQDKEIKLLQKELEEEKQKKKALMQLLLTGIVRV